MQYSWFQCCRIGWWWGERFENSERKTVFEYSSSCRSRINRIEVVLENRNDGATMKRNRRYWEKRGRNRMMHSSNSSNAEMGASQRISVPRLCFTPRRTSSSSSSSLCGSLDSSGTPWLFSFSAPQSCHSEKIVNNYVDRKRRGKANAPFTRVALEPIASTGYFPGKIYFRTAACNETWVFGRSI